MFGGLQTIKLPWVHKTNTGEKPPKLKTPRTVHAMKLIVRHGFVWLKAGLVCFGSDRTQIKKPSTSKSQKKAPAKSNRSPETSCARRILLMNEMPGLGCLPSRANGPSHHRGVLGRARLITQPGQGPLVPNCYAGWMSIREGLEKICSCKKSPASFAGGAEVCGTISSRKETDRRSKLNLTSKR